MSYAKLWCTAGQFNESFPAWMDGPVFEIDPDRLEKDVADWVISMTKMKKQFKGLWLRVHREFIPAAGDSAH